MGPRFIFAALTLAFGVALVLATLTTMHQMSVHSSSERTTVTTGLGLPALSGKKEAATTRR